MKTAQHTPGPWGIDAEHGTQAPRIFSDGGNYRAGMRIATLPTTAELEMFGPDIEDAQANARLICAAPDLLAASRPFIQWVYIGKEGWPNEALLNEAVETARALLAKAQGEGV